VPARWLEQLGITARHLEAIEVLGLSLEEAVELGALWQRLR
jgi:hypothetical protein